MDSDRVCFSKKWVFCQICMISIKTFKNISTIKVFRVCLSSVWVLWMRDPVDRQTRSKRHSDRRVPHLGLSTKTKWKKAPDSCTSVLRVRAEFWKLCPAKFRCILPIMTIWSSLVSRKYLYVPSEPPQTLICQSTDPWVPKTCGTKTRATWTGMDFSSHLITIKPEWPRSCHRPLCPGKMWPKMTSKREFRLWKINWSIRGASRLWWWVNRSLNPKTPTSRTLSNSKKKQNPSTNKCS